jgi:hypothetical protein
MSPEELAAAVCQALRTAGITVTLTGGACVAIWSSGKYASNDLDFIEEGPVSRQQLIQALRPLGFRPGKGRHFDHPQHDMFVEFPAGPLMVGNERVLKTVQRRTDAGTLRLLSPTDCVKDRLAAYFHWDDRQALDQALLVAGEQRIDLPEVRRWSRQEGHESKFEVFDEQVGAKRRARGSRRTSSSKRRRR